MSFAAQSEHPASNDSHQGSKRRRKSLDRSSNLQTERAVGDYATTLEWLRCREHALRREGHRVHRATFRARRQRWISKITIELTPQNSALGDVRAILT